MVFTIFPAPEAIFWIWLAKPHQETKHDAKDLEIVYKPLALLGKESPPTFPRVWRQRQKCEIDGIEADFLWFQRENRPRFAHFWTKKARKGPKMEIFKIKTATLLSGLLKRSRRTLRTFAKSSVRNVRKRARNVRKQSRNVRKWGLKCSKAQNTSNVSQKVRSETFGKGRETFANRPETFANGV